MIAIFFSLGFSRNQHTWVTTCSGGIKERLDYVLASLSWKNLFGNARVTHLDPSTSDHVPIIISLDEGSTPRKKCRHGFLFEEYWANHDNCESVIREAWERPVVRVPIYQVVHKIKATRVALLKWQKVVFKRRQNDITRVRSKLGLIPAQPLSDKSIVKRTNLLDQHNRLLGQEKTFWRQRSRIL